MPTRHCSGHSAGLRSIHAPSHTPKAPWPLLDAAIQIRRSRRGRASRARADRRAQPWPHPLANRNGVDGSGRARGVVLYGSLARAVQHEANLAVAYWFGVTGQTVTKWRRALDVPRITDGQQRLMVEYGKEPWFIRAQRKAVSKARDPGRIAKIAAAGTGRPMHPNARAALLKANTGRKPSDSARAKMSATRKRLGIRPPWIAPAWPIDHDELVMSHMPAPEVARRTGRSLCAVYSRRYKLRQANAPG